MKLIDADRLEFIRLPDRCNEDFTDGVEYILNRIDCMKGVDAEPVIHAHWELECEPNGKPYCLHCSYCDKDWHCTKNTNATNYCPDCGAKMDEEGE